MYARVWRFGILPGKVNEFDTVIKSVIPAWRQMPGFRGLLVLRTGPGEMLDGTVISTWHTLDDLRGSENTTFQQTVARLLSFCEPHPTMREEEVIVSEHASAAASDITAIY
jgi:heme-degrading monooxygenase HmoA